MPRVEDSCREHLSDFGLQGLRTLVMAHATLNEQTFAQWQRQYLAAKSSVQSE